MVHWDDHFWPIYAIIAPISGCASLFMMYIISIWKVPKQLHFLSAVFWMCCSDFLSSFRISFEFFVYRPHDNLFCIFNALLGTFANIASISWHMVIAVTIVLIFLGVETSIFRRWYFVPHMYVWVTAFVCMLIPLLLKHYGPMPDDGTCWILPEYRLTRFVLVLPMAVSLISSLILLALILYLYHKNRISVAHRLHLRMTGPFVLNFVLLWSWRFIYETWSMSDSNNFPPQWLRYLNIIALVSSGFCNVVLWFFWYGIGKTLIKKKFQTCIMEWCLDPPNTIEQLHTHNYERSKSRSKSHWSYGSSKSKSQKSEKFLSSQNISRSASYRTVSILESTGGLTTIDEDDSPSNSQH